MEQDLYFKQLMTMLATPVVVCCGFEDACECEPHVPVHKNPDCACLYEDDSSGL